MAQTWTGGNLGTDMNWSDAANWSGGAPNSSSAVLFPDGAYPITTNIQGAVNNIVQSSTTISTLTYANNGAGSHFVTTQVPAGSALTVSGAVTIGNAGVAVTTTFSGGGSLVAGNGSSTLAVQSTSGTATLDLSSLTNFSFNAGGASSGAINLSTGSSSATGKINLADGSNNITCGTLSLGNNNTGGSGTMNLGNGTNIINADTIDMAMDKTAGTMQFLNNGVGGVKIANHTGTGRATINLGSVANSGGTSAKSVASMLFNGGAVNILASTMTVGNRGNRAASGGNGSETGILTFNSGLVDVTTINMAVSSSSAGGFGTISVGNTGTLRIGSGGLSLVNSTGTAAGSGALLVTNGGTITCAYDIYKSSSLGTAMVTVVSSTLTLSGSMGVTNNIPIDFLFLTNSTLNLSLASAPAISAINFNPDATTHNTINLTALPTITAIPSQYQVFTYTTGGGNLNSLVLGTLPTGFSGYISNNPATSSIDLVLTNGPVAKTDEWGGGVNNQWDTTSLNWTNSGVAVTYNDLDDVVFDDLAQTPNVNITGSRAPATWTMQNSVLNYVFSGAGRITGPVQLVMNGSAAVTLAETGGDNFSGGISIGAGKLILDDTNGAITGGVSIGGGTVLQIGNNDGSGNLPGGTINDGGNLIFARTNNFSTGSSITGGGGLIQNGTGTLTLTASEPYSGATLVNAGTLALTGSGAIPDSAEVNVTNAALDVSGVTSIAIMTAVDLTNATLDLKAGYVQTNFNVSSLNLGGTGNVINVKSLPQIVFYPATIPLIHSANPIVGYNFTLGSLPASTPPSVGSIALSADQSSVLLTLTSGPTNSRPSVIWDGNDALANGNTNWSDAQNWLSPGTPMAGEVATFNDTASVGGSPFNSVGQGGTGIVTPGNINNYVDINLTNAGLNYVNTSGYQNTQVSPGNALTENGSVSVTGSGGNVAIAGASAAFRINASSGTLTVANGTTPTLDMSGLDTFNAKVGQIGIAYNPASPSSLVSGTWYMAETNYITAGPGSFGTAAALVVGGNTIQNAGTLTGTVYLGQSNVLNLDGIVLGAADSSHDTIQFNPNLTGNPVAYIRGLLGGSSRVTLWSLGDDTVNINNTVGSFGHVNDFSAGTLNAMVATLIVGQGNQGNEINNNVIGTFTMGAGNLDVTTLEIGVAANGKNGGEGNGVMTVTGGSLEVNTLELAIGTVTNTTGTLNLINATMVVSNAVILGAGVANAGATLGISASTVKILNGSIGSTNGLANLNLDGSTIQVNVNGSDPYAVIVATNVTTTANITTINLAAITNVFNTTQLPLLSYVGTDPFAALQLGPAPVGYTVTLVDNTANSSVDVNIVSPFRSRPHITGVSVSGPTLNITATNGAINGQFVLLGTTNLALPLAQWKPILTNNFDGSGDLNLSTNIIQSTVPTEFFDVSQ